MHVLQHSFPRVKAESPAEKNTHPPDVVSHHFVGDQYAKVMRLEQGETALTHSHKFDHESVLAIGEVLVTCDGVQTRYTAPAMVTIKSGVSHSIHAIKPVLWLCIHEVPADLQDRSQIDEVLIK